MSQKGKTKEEIVAEYLTGNYTYRELRLKYGIPFRSICNWVLDYQGRKTLWRGKGKMKRNRKKETGLKEPELPNEVKLLQKELKNQQLYNRLLEEIIHIANKETGTDWKKSLSPSNNEYWAKRKPEYTNALLIAWLQSASLFSNKLTKQKKKCYNTI